MRTGAHVVIVMSLVFAVGCSRVGDMADRVRDRFDGAAAPVTVSAEASAGSRTAMPDVSGQASWDGMPSLGGVWVAHPDVVEPEPVRISRAGGGSVEGWLFSRDAGGEGPALQVSSEAALELDIAAGVRVDLIVEPLATAPGTG